MNYKVSYSWKYDIGEAVKSIRQIILFWETRNCQHCVRSTYMAIAYLTKPRICFRKKELEQLDHKCKNTSLSFGFQKLVTSLYTFWYNLLLQERIMDCSYRLFSDRQKKKLIGSYWTNNMTIFWNNFSRKVCLN